MCEVPLYASMNPRARKPSGGVLRLNKNGLINRIPALVKFSWGLINLHCTGRYLRALRDAVAGGSLKHRPASAVARLGKPERGERRHAAMPRHLRVGRCACINIYIYIYIYIERYRYI